MLVADCKKSVEPYGAWIPSQAVVADVFRMSGASNACYCASGLVRPVEACMKKLGTSLVEVTIGTPDDPTDCTVHVSAAEWGLLRWVRVEADNRDLATFYSVDVVVSVQRQSVAPYYEGFNGLPKPGEWQGEEGVSEQMRAEWGGLPDELRAFLGERR